MSIYLEQIKQLVALQKVDSEIYTVKKELDKAPLEVAELKSALEKATEERERLTDKYNHLREQAKRLEIELVDESDRLDKSKNKLMQIGSDKEYNAVMREMDTLEKSNREREDEKSLLMEELNRQNADLSEINAKYETLSKELEEKEGSLQGVLDKCGKEMESLEKRRNSTGNVVPAPVLQRYEFIRERLEQPVIVSVRAGICSGCNISIPPQSFIELQKGTQILSCPNCQRLVYWCEHFQS